MWIEQIDIAFGSFDGMKPVRFQPGVNIIRGENGVGKTTVLEFASLIGHVALMRVADESSDERVDVRVFLDKADVTFLQAIKSHLTDLLLQAAADTESAFTAASSWTAAYLSALHFNGLDPVKASEVDIPSGHFTLSFFLDGVDESEIKDVLSSDQKIRNSIRVYSPDGDPLVVQMLNCWSRPFCMGTTEIPGPWSVTPRTIGRSLIEARPAPQGIQSAAGLACGATFYMNTDMYEFGAGLDVRESPKDLKDNLSAILIRRLQLVRPGGIVDGASYLDEQFRPDVGRNIDGLEEIQSAWEHIFGPRHTLEVCRAKRIAAAGDGLDCISIASCFEWSFRIGDRDRRKFVSSGENQALFVLAMLCNMATAGSIVMIDEPELHLTFSAGTRLMHSIMKLSRREDRPFQVIVVTHLPHLFRNIVAAPCDNPTDWQREKVNFVYLARGDGERVEPLYGLRAVSAAARSSHGDAIEMGKGVELEQEVSIWFWIPDWLNSRTAGITLAVAAVLFGLTWTLT